MSSDHDRAREEAAEFLRRKAEEAERLAAEEAPAGGAGGGYDEGGYGGGYDEGGYGGPMGGMGDGGYADGGDGGGGGGGGEYGGEGYAEGGYEGEYGDGGGGGYAEEEVPNFAWSRPVMTGVPPPARGGHAAGLVGNLLIVFGGHYYGGSGKFQYLDDVWAIDVDTMTWHNPTCAGGGPSARYGHTATVIEYKLYVFGGRGPKGQLHNDVWCLDVERWTWERMSSTTAPPLGRFGHSQLLVGNKIVFFGGWDGTRAFNDLWVYDTGAFCWIKPRVGGTPPSARYGHSSALSRDGRVLVYGGAGVDAKGRPQYLSDVKQLDTETMVWARCRVTGDHPKARMQAATADVANTMCLFGGWSGVHKSIVPEAAIVRDASRARSTDPAGVQHPHMYLLDLAALEWTQPKITGTAPSQRYGHSVTAVGSKLLIFGGWDGNRPLNDVLQLEVAPVLEA